MARRVKAAVEILGVYAHVPPSSAVRAYAKVLADLPQARRVAAARTALSRAVLIEALVHHPTKGFEFQFGQGRDRDEQLRVGSAGADARWAGGRRARGAQAVRSVPRDGVDPRLLGVEADSHEVRRGECAPRDGDAVAAEEARAV